MTTQSYSQGPTPGAFLARAPVSSHPYENGVLHASAAGLSDGTLVRDNGGGLLVQWADDGPLAGILILPARDEVASGRLRVTLVARDAVVHLDRLTFPPEHINAAKSELDRVGILWRERSLPGG